MKKTLFAWMLIAAAACAADKPAVKSVRLYVFDCGKLHYDDPTRFNFKKEEVKVYDLSVGCYLIAHPKGTLMWDVGVIPDAAFPNDGKPGHETIRHRHQTAQVAARRRGLQPGRHHLLGNVSLPLGPPGQRQ